VKNITLIIGLFILVILTSCGGGSGPVYPPDPTDGRPASYSLLYEDKVCRWDDSAFPLKVYIDPPPVVPGGYGPTLFAAAVAGIEMWDGEIQDLPNLFDHHEDFFTADIICRWEDMDLAGYTLATEFSNYVTIHKIAINEGLRDPAEITLIMGHELGHVLGLNLSGVSGDLMFSHVNPGSTTLTKRDHDMINWLYSRDSYVPIRTY